MPKSYTPYGAANPVDNLAALNDVFQEKENYFLGLLENGANGRRWLDAEAGENLADRDAAYISLADNKIYKMDSDAAGPKAGAIRGFIDGAVLSGATGRLVIGGSLNGFAGLTATLAVFVSTTAGGITQTKPAPSLDGSQVMIAEMGIATDTDTVFVRQRVIQYLKRAALSDNETVTISHHADNAGYQRKRRAYYSETEAGPSHVTYASSNQDSSVALSDKTVATYTADLCTGGTPIGNMINAGGLAGAFDNNPAVGAGKTTVSGQIGYDFGVGITKTIRRYTVTEISTQTETAAPKDWTFEYSNDNSNWTIADTQTSQTGWTNGQMRTFNVNVAVAARYWRLNITDNNGAAAALYVGELEMMEAATFTDGASKLAQIFNLGSTETIGSVSLWLKKVGSPTGTVTVRIETVSGGNPTGTLAHANATATFNEADLTTSYAAKLVTFSSFSLASADYAIVLSTSRAASETDYIDWGADGSSPGYAGGEMKTYASAVWSAASKDAIFTVSDEGYIHPQKVKVGWWSSSFADLVSCYGDGAGADLSTKTAFKCLRDAGFDDMTMIVELN